MEAHYKGFVSKIFFSSEASGFYGEVMNVDEHIAFQAETTNTIMKAMQDAIDRYLYHTQPETRLIEYPEFCAD